MWKTFADDCQNFDTFPHFALSFIDIYFYFCNHLEDKKQAVPQQEQLLADHYLFLEN